MRLELPAHTLLPSRETADRAGPRSTPLPRLVAMLAVLYAAACGLGLALLVAAFRVGLLARLDILFYRGLIVIALAALATFAILGLVVRRLGGGALGLRDAFSAAVLSLSLNVSFLVVVPVTVDRSISIFLLGEMAARPEAALTPDAASRLFKSVYVDEYRQIDRRLQEQAASGNLEKIGPSDVQAYRITPRGRLVVDAAKAVAWMFDSRWGLAAPPARGVAGR